MIPPVDPVESLLGRKIVVTGNDPIGPRSHWNEVWRLVVDFLRVGRLWDEWQKGLRHLADATLRNLIPRELLSRRRTRDTASGDERGVGRPSNRNEDRNWLSKSRTCVGVG